MSGSVLIPGTTCWRIAHAERMAVIIDAASYFAHLKAAILAARHSVLLIGWDFDMRVALEREERDRSVPNRLGSLLRFAAKRNPGLRVYVLRWDLAFLKMPLRGTTPLFLMNLITSRRMHFRLDSHHPAEACHHQKIVVIDDAIAFCGGIDITMNRWDTPAHLDDDPRRDHALEGSAQPWHDATTAVDGEAARALGELARDRWFVATGRRLPAAPHDRAIWPEGLTPRFRDVDVAIARTEPPYDGQPGAREIEALYLAAIGAARRTIYLESQYFSGHRIGRALAARLAEPDGPEVVIVNPRRAHGWLEEEVMGSARALLLRQLGAADRHGRLRVFTPVTEGGTDIYVHAKLLVIDDRLLRVGSSNVNNRSMGLDTECDLVVEARAEDARAPALREAILDVRDALVSEHLGVPREHLQAVLREADGSLVTAIDRLRRPSGRRLVPFTPPELTPVEQALAETHVLDPSRPESMAQTFVRTLRVLSPGWGAAGLGLGAAAVAGATVAWRRRQS